MKHLRNVLLLAVIAFLAVEGWLHWREHRFDSTREYREHCWSFDAWRRGQVQLRALGHQPGARDDRSPRHLHQHPLPLWQAAGAGVAHAITRIGRIIASARHP